MVTVVEERKTAAEMPRVGHLTGDKQWDDIPDLDPTGPKDKARILHFMRSVERGGAGQTGQAAMRRFGLIGPTVGIIRKLLQQEAETGVLAAPQPEEAPRARRAYRRRVPIVAKPMAAKATRATQGRANYADPENGHAAWEVSYACTEKIEAPSLRGALREMEARGASVTDVFSIHRVTQEQSRRRGRPPTR